MQSSPTPRPGRPPNTSREEIAGIALALFIERGFDRTTLDDIAAAVGVSRRTILRYYGSKNDLVWGTFTEQLEGLRTRLRAADPSQPLMEAISRAVVAFNDYGDAQLPELRERMTMITTVPALQGHAMRRYGDWCGVVAEFVAYRLGGSPEDHIPQVIANAALGTAMATYRHWIRDQNANLLADLRTGFELLATGFDETALRSNLGSRPLPVSD